MAHKPKYKRVGGRFVQEHILIVEKALGKSIPKGAVIHHVDENPQHNWNTNLVLCQDKAYHWLLHARQRVLKDGFNPDTHKKCTDCGMYLIKAIFNRDKSRYDALQARCKVCNSLRHIKFKEKEDGKKESEVL